MRKVRNRFGVGGCYTCRDCKRKTRSTGRGDNENCGLCVECYEKCSIENQMADHGDSDELLGDWMYWVNQCKSKGGKPSEERWWE